MNYNKIAILIPTFNPGESLIKTIDILNKNGFNHIIIVNDGSKNTEVFSKISVDKVLKHDVNKGKGAALKTGFQYLQKLSFEGVITLDDDLQQDILDIKNIANAFLNDKGIYFGVRKFEGAPIIRKIANKMASKLFKLVYKEDICDTQTGLRCFPKENLFDLINIEGNRFEYEMNVLKYLAMKEIQIKKIDIKTIYNDNKSHYRALKDSYQIFKALLKK